MKTEFKIDKGVPLPQPRRKYPLDKMKVGDSFFLPVETPRTKVIDNRIRSTLYSTSRNQNIHITIRKVQGGFRVWRTSGSRKGAK